MNWSHNSYKIDASFKGRYRHYTRTYKNYDNFKKKLKELVNNPEVHRVRFAEIKVRTIDNNIDLLLLLNQLEKENVQKK